MKGTQQGTLDQYYTKRLGSAPQKTYKISHFLDPCFSLQIVCAMWDLQEIKIKKNKIKTKVRSQNFFHL